MLNCEYSITCNTNRSLFFCISYNVALQMHPASCHTNKEFLEKSRRLITEWLYLVSDSNSWKLKASAKVDQTSTGKVADHQRPVINSPQKFPAGLKQEISGDILCDDYQWPVSDPAHRHPNEVKHVVFVKVCCGLYENFGSE